MLRRFLQDEDEGSSLLTRIRNKPYQYIILFLCLLNFTLVMVNAGLWIIAAHQRLFVAADFTSFYTGYYIVRAGEGENLYDPVLQSAYQQEFMGGITFEGGLLPYPNPPHVAIVLSPLSYLRLDAAFYLWTVFQVVILGWIIYLLIKIFPEWEKREHIIMVLTILAFWPLTYTFLLGQFSLLLLLSLVQMYISMKRSRFLKAGLWMFLLTIKPHSLFIPGLMTLHKRFWRIAATAVITGILVFLLSSLLMGSKPWKEYFDTLLSFGTYFDKFGFHPNSQYTLRGTLSTILDGMHGETINLISIIVLVIGMVFVWVLWSKGIDQQSSRFSLYFAFTILLSGFLSLHQYPHDSLILVFPAILFYEYLRSNDLPRKAYPILLLLSPLVFFFTSFSDFEFLGAIRLPVIIELVLVVWMGKYIIRGQITNRNPNLYP